VHVFTEVTNGEAVMHVTGEVDASNASELRDAFLSVLGDGARSLVIDCARLTFIDSTGLSAIIAANRAADLQFGTVTVRNPSPMVMRLLEVTGLADRLTTET
jgi:anti-anti-sigma factor